MLSIEEKQKIEHEISLVPSPKNACIEALKIVQHSHGWISDDSLKDVADFVGMSTAELDSVATFYNLIFRRPVGRHVILLCDSISCYVMGYDGIRDHLYTALNIQYGQTTADGRYTLLPNCCLGTCDRAPALMIDNDLYRDLTVEQLDEILSKYT
ncbi:NADH-quinone oxidoreductase subunit NuoE [Pontibacter sp. E15-1]|uniref:NADH-quinone oxidoreductase subunit NuoE n=1 Tax=Pontibacter sp. E15-1 TaxID=2919918 RepID=UPI001F4FC8E3|nr:NADH-quinone oxidoreductase subunit NuoE [Pontibacter sp. E15-1]MCJ8164345.1 NADH-quinone oxidoreductase subunit NuoE [Pontibacter sp. E15-1]